MAGVFLGWQPLLLSYGFASNITDLTHLWPYALGLGFVQRALIEDNPVDGGWAGLFFAVGFLTCPYNFVLFIPVLPAMILWVVLCTSEWRALLWKLSTVAGALLILYGLRVGYVMNQDGSLVATDAVESVRHVYPFDGLRADKETRFTAFLTELFGVMPRPVVIMEQVARFARHFQWGVLSLCAVGVGLVTASSVRWFLSVGILLGIGSSIGPFATWSPFVELSEAYNPIYWWSYKLPLGKMILEPFRYVLVSGLFMAVAVGLGLQRLQKWGMLFGIVMLGEMAWRSPQWLLPVQPIAWDDRMEQVDFADGGIVHLPFFVSKSNRFDRQHFLFQMQHGHPITDPIMGFPAPYMIENAVLCQLIHAESVQFPMEFFPCGRETLRKGWQELQDSGVGSIVFDPAKYASGDWKNVQQIVQQLSVEPRSEQGLIILEFPTSR